MRAAFYRGDASCKRATILRIPSGLAVAAVMLLSSSLWAQPQAYNHPELSWFTIQGEHSYVHFHNGTERTARIVAKIVDDIYYPVTSQYDFEPAAKIHFIIRDHDDYSNGAAFYYDNKVEIWASNFDFMFRGSHNWLRNTVTHEFTHMIQLQASRKITSRIPAVYLQAIGYEEDKREDVLHGGPNVLVSYPIAMTVMPGWFAEGAAQYQVPGLDYETWDSHRDMILRTSALDNKLLTYRELGNFGKNSLGNEKVYNHGFAFVSYIADNYGVTALRDISRKMKGLFRVTLDGALRDVTGKSADQLHKDWTNELKQRYHGAMRHVIANEVSGKFLEDEGMANLYPAWSPDGSKLAYLTNKGNDYFSQTTAVIRDMNTGRTQSIKAAATGAISWSPDGSKLVFSNKTAKGKGGSRFFDLYTYDVLTKKKHRLTKALRGNSPNWSHGGGQIAFVTTDDGTENIASLDVVGKEIKQRTHYKNGEQISKPEWSPDDNLVLFSMFTNGGQNIYTLDMRSGEVKPLVSGTSDSRDATFGPEGKTIYFSWDRTGIFNIYAKDLVSGEVRQLTNVLGGAFMPAVNDKGQIAFSHFTSTGYKLALLDDPQQIDEAKTQYLAQKNGVREPGAAKSAASAGLEGIGVNQYDDTDLPALDAKPYKSHYSRVAFLPRALLDYGTLKLGTYLYSYDVLNKYGFIAGFDANKRGDYDLFALVDYRNLGPTLFLEAYNQVQHTSAEVDSFDFIIRRLYQRPELNGRADDEFKYNLMEINAGASFKLNDRNEVRTSVIYSRYSGKVKFQEFNQVAILRYNYFIGRALSVRYLYENRAPNVDSAINPLGRRFSLRYDLEFNKFLQGFDIDEAILQEVFDNYNYNKFSLNWVENLALPIKNHTFNIELQAGFIDTEVDSFFNFFAGGILGNRGYPYFSIEGRKMLQGRFTYRLPFLRNLDARFMHLYFDKVFLGVFYDFGNAFNESKPRLDDFKSTVGFQIRMDATSFYTFPTRIFFNAAYGLDRFQIDDQIYGKEWRYYFGLTFGFFD